MPSRNITLAVYLHYRLEAIFSDKYLYRLLIINNNYKILQPLFIGRINTNINILQFFFFIKIENLLAADTIVRHRPKKVTFTINFSENISEVTGNISRAEKI